MDSSAAGGIFLILTGVRLHLALSALSLRHLSFLRFDHFLDHIAAHRTVLFGGKVSVVSIRKRYAQFIGDFEFETV